MGDKAVMVVASDKNDLLEMVRQDVLGYVTSGSALNLAKAKEVLEILNEVASKIKGAAKKQIQDDKAILDAAMKDFE